MNWVTQHAAGPIGFTIDITQKWKRVEIDRSRYPILSRIRPSAPEGPTPTGVSDRPSPVPHDMVTIWSRASHRAVGAPRGEGTSSHSSFAIELTGTPKAFKIRSTAWTVLRSVWRDGDQIDFNLQ